MDMTASRIHHLERASLLAALATLTLLAWWMMVAQPGMGAMMNRGTAATLALNTIMWCVMMVAMMLPSASPMILTYARVHQSRASNRRATVPTWVFMIGYLAVWGAFSLMAAMAQWALHQGALLSSAMGHVGAVPGGGLLILAGLFQFSGLKQACMDKCRSPLSFLMTEWRDGVSGALVMGMRHGAFCAGCCWALMLLMFTGGVMSLLWRAALALYFLAEKLLPWPRQMGYATGTLLVLGGAALIVGGA